MASVPVPVTNVGRGYTIITQVLPSSTVEQNSTQTLSPLSKFLKGEPKALGTVQIMIGLLTFLFGIVLATYTPMISIFSGIVFWSSVFHIIAGSLAVSASNKLNSCVVKATLTLNIFSTLSAGITIIILILDLIFGSYVYRYSYYEDSYSYNYYASEGMRKGITGVLLVFTLLQFCISIAVSAFTCKATCTSEPSLNIINVIPNPESFAPSAPVNNPFPPHHTQQGVNSMHGIAMATAPGENPPAYSEKCNQTTEKE
ncbi:membrane-spanning 4-domains subfamily A member 4A-like [Tachysurus fulvidraco]|uniref:membrane-spanning 4-domains subfamily A member 4A-like n=1 Tax=Tachysurus fulvidraco TaxID=1234273 RepID=UPI001FEFECEB|nr:membrane-spanning 4-domains subfamily A member 4A-like [Tachysurus fulvidraco]